MTDTEIQTIQEGYKMDKLLGATKPNMMMELTDSKWEGWDTSECKDVPLFKSNN